MTSHSYYKDRLGFDPNEQQPGSNNSMKRSSSRQTTHHHQSYHHATTSSSQSPARISVSPGGNNGTLEYQQVQREQRDRELYSNNGSLHHHQHHHHHHRHSTTGSASSPLYENSSSPAAPKKAKHSSTQAQPQGGYEDALTQFKGSMSIWDHFIEDWDIMRKWEIGFLRFFWHVLCSSSLMLPPFLFLFFGIQRKRFINCRSGNHLHFKFASFVSRLYEFQL